jgi:hypothetical protein
LDIKLVLAISILLQITAAALALRLIKITDRSISWILLALAISLMAIRRSVTLFHMVAGKGVPADWAAETVALLTSALLVAGIAFIAPLFLSIKHSEEAVKKAGTSWKYVFRKGRQIYQKPTRYYRRKSQAARRLRRKFCGMQKT